MNRTVTTKAYAKINLFLDVKEKRPDGYHNIESVMQQISLFDTITVLRSDAGNSKNISIECTDKSIPEDKRNIAYKCAEAFFEKFEIKNYDITIHIDKRIPSAAGLAGGSSDGAAVLTSLNILFDVNAGISELCETGAKIGADIPFCLIGGTCICSGIGDVIVPCDIPQTSYQILLVFPGIAVSTAAAYKLIDETEREERLCSAEDIISDLQNGRMPSKLYNSFEKVTIPENPIIDEIKRIMQKFGGNSLMSGSGPTVFGLFRDEESLNKAKIDLLAKGFRPYVCVPNTK
ncbi:MAG: 4-(cytidine 5'-diphospho)-2-C-methyl-D-erythritol kinase [Ruminococcaceae bacterium]|nr:4-(cytidine 5'-diphospho)-2-C-methyl-D-erythritol kinase [Oscillospiraceae bacterium]